MSYRKHRSLLSTAVLLALGGLGSAVRAESSIVTFGGGSVPTSNQVSLLRNVEYFDRVRRITGIDKLPYQVYFADGGKSEIVQTQVPETERQKLANLLGTLLFTSESTKFHFFRAESPNLVGPSTGKEIEAWFDAGSKKLKPADRLVFYFTGHGGPDERNRNAPRNTTLYLWGDPKSYTVKQFEQQLSKLDPGVEVTLVMVQCHSGGFANVIYNEGDPEKGFSKHLRAGFFSTTAPRLAAGCTSAIEEQDYHEFSTSFFEALSGESRTGKPIEKPDYDGDGKVSYTEAFSYTLIHSPTIDIPVTTSDQLLRDKSRLRGANDGAELLAADTEWAALLRLATPAEKVVLNKLSDELGLEGESRLQAARTLAEQLDKEVKESKSARRSSRNEESAEPGPASRPATEPSDRSDTRSPTTRRATPQSRLRSEILLRWPELGVPFSPNANAILEKAGPAIREFLDSSPDYKAYVDARTARRATSDAAYKTELKWVKLQRLIERADTVLLASNLRKVGNDEAVKVYDQLIALERKTLDAK